MAKYIDFEVSGKILLPCAGTRAVVSCNSDYRLRFTFSSDWGDFPDKTVLLSDKKVFYSIPLSSGATECALPRIDKPRVFDIGITASDGDGATVTTAPLTLTVLPSIRSKADGNIEASETASDELARLSEALEAAQSAVEGISEATEAARSAALRANEAADSVSVEKEEAAYAAARANTAANAAEGAIITNAQINSAGDLILTRSDGGEHDCGRARGEAGTVISGDEPTDESHPVWLCPDGEFEGIYELPGVSSADAGKVLRVSAAGEWEAADGDGDSKPFVVTVTCGDDDTLTADKTHAEIVAAYAKGAQINAKIVNYPGVIVPSILPLYVNISDEMFMFSGSGVLDGSAMAMTATDTNGSWRVELAELATLGDIPSGGTDTSLGITGATVGQTVKIKSVDENGVPTEWEAADAASGGDGWTEIGELTVEGTEFIISDYTDGVITVTPDNGIYPSVDRSYVIRKPDYSAYINARIVATETEGKFTLVNLDNVVYTPSEDLTQYVIDATTAWGELVFSNLPSFSYLKIGITTPLLSSHGSRSTIAISGKIQFTIGAACSYLTGGAVEAIIETDESPVSGKDYVKASFKGKQANRSNGYDVIDFINKSTSDIIKIGHYNGLMVSGTNVKLWGRN